MSTSNSPSALSVYIIISWYEFIYNECLANPTPWVNHGCREWKFVKESERLIANLPAPKEASHWERSGVFKEVYSDKGYLHFLSRFPWTVNLTLGEMISDVQIPPECMAEVRGSTYWQYTRQAREESGR